MKISIPTGFYVPIFVTLFSLLNNSKTTTAESYSKDLNAKILSTKPAAYMSVYGDLMDIYNNTNGANWTTNTNWGDASVDFDQWYGVTANGNNVSHIIMKNNNLNGTLSSSIGNFSSLITLDLADNNLTGTIPSTVTSLTSLSSLRLGNNSLSGPIPTSWSGMTNIYAISLYDNNLTGGIPTGLGSAPNLAHLSLSGNNLGGTIPSSIGNLTNADIHLDLADTGISGNIPSSLGNLDIHLLYLNGNNLSGTIPSNLGNYTYNNFLLNFDNNNLNGCFPSTFNTYCTSYSPTITAYGNTNMSVNDLTTFCNNGGSCTSGCSGVDLLVNSITLSATTVAPGGSITLGFGIKNDCTTNAGSSNQKWYLSTNNSYDASDIELGTYNISNINGNTIHSVSNQSINIASSQNTGDYFIIVYADKDDDVTENNEGNNTLFKPITISNSGGGGGHTSFQSHPGRDPSGSWP